VDKKAIVLLDKIGESRFQTPQTPICDFEKPQKYGFNGKLTVSGFYF
jgi:hypothetical protein